MFNDLHESHVGTARMKSLARAIKWWPKIDQNIHAICQESRPIPSKAPLQPWEWPTKPMVKTTY